MGFHRGLALFTLIAIGLFGVLDAQPAENGNTTQYGSVVCLLSGDIMNVTVFIFRNQSNITGAEFANYNNWETRYRSGDCVFQGDGSSSSPFMAFTQVNVSSDAAAPGKTFCGHQQVANLAQNEPKAYSWIVHTYHELNKDRFGDLYIRFTCTPSDLPTNVSVEYNILPPPTRTLTEVHGTATLNVLNTNNQAISSVVISTPVRLELEYTPSAFNISDGHDESLRPSGIYCKTLVAAPSLSSSRRVSMQDVNGCPGSGPFQAASSFINQNATNKYVARTGNFPAIRFDALTNEAILPTRGQVVFICEAAFCVAVDSKLCDKRCQTARRRRREVIGNDTVETVTLVAVLNVVDASENTDTEKSSSIPLGYVVGLAVAGFVLLVAALLLVIAVMRRRPQRKEKYHRHSNPSSVASSTTTSSYTGRTTSYLPSKHYRY